MDVLFLLASGAVAGMFAGLLGIGGGIIIVPVLAMVFTAQGVSIDVLMHVAIGTSLATIVVTSLSSIRAHHKHQAIDWPVVRVITIGVFVGGLIGAAIAKQIPGEDLKLIFSIFMFLIAAQMYFGNTAKAHRTLPAKPGMILAGTSIGTIASLMGVGGGSMSVPFLTWCNMSIRKAVATSSAIGFPIAVAGTIGFIVTGWSAADRPVMSLGYVNFPAFISIVVASVLSAPLGAWIAHRISPITLKRIFAGFLVILGIRMLTTL
ncbi:MAG: sulfite exporter TauE/SafE family protein [Gammaproteobacteria bacterium]|nr:sulfite exporter TauE/SafE family protein [Gammaproteobacteria bacterium]MDH5659900.1 sulfite exporter TauE/SafE family protein [Gammaproteobacteria bacterium]